MKKWLMVLGIVFVVEVIAEAAHLMSQYVFLAEVPRNSIIAFIALVLSVSLIVNKE